MKLIAAEQKELCASFPFALFSGFLDLMRVLIYNRIRPVKIHPFKSHALIFSFCL